ncbi:Flagellar assembly factor FliW [compost metagenome]
MTEGLNHTEAEDLVIHSSAYGELKYSSNLIYQFEKGILGVQHIKKYALFPIGDSPFSVLHSVDEQVSFILIPAGEVVKDYDFRIDQELVDTLGISVPEDVVVFLIVNMQQNSLYVNLKAPVLISLVSRTGCQHVITEKEYPIRYLLTKKEDSHASS